MKSRILALWDAVEEVRRSESLAQLAAVTKRFATSMGFAHHGFAVRFHDTARNGIPSYYNFRNIPDPWGQVRYEQTYGSNAEQRDPLIQHVQAGLPPTAFSSRGIVTHTRSEIVRRGAPILRRASEYGIRAGILAPLASSGMQWGFLVMTTGDTDDVRDVQPHLPSMFFFANFILFSARDHFRQRMAIPSLTPREREMLTWAAIGKSSWEIGVITSLSAKTVDFHLLSAARKLGVRGRRAAVCRAVLLGLISI